MNKNENYITSSLELTLFFARIMKEHSIFLKAGFTPVDMSFAKTADFFKMEFEKLLSNAVMLGNGNIRQNVISSGELVTEFTLTAEKQTQQFTGIAINKMITMRESKLTSGFSMFENTMLAANVSRLNKTALRLVNGLIEFKEKILERVLHCSMFTANYPLLIEHILREAKLYRDMLMHLESGETSPLQTMREMEVFWNNIMREHALFIRGSLDPTEEQLIMAANTFADDYAVLLESASQANDPTLFRNESLQETIKFQQFKTAGTKGIEACDIRSIILPLLADHVLREANHFIRLLNEEV